MCAGNSVCGSSAIGTVSGVIHPSAKDKGISITTVNLTGTVLMITLPFSQVLFTEMKRCKLPR